MTDWLPALIPVLLVFVAAWVAMARFRRDRIWERKMEAYDRVIEALHVMKSIEDTEVEAAASYSELSKEVEDRHRAEYQAAQREVVRAVNIGEYALDPRAVAHLRAFLGELERAVHEDHWFEALVAGQEAATSCLEKVTEIARTDLKFPKNRAKHVSGRTETAR